MKTWKVEIVRTNAFGQIASDARAFRTYEVEAASAYAAQRAAIELATAEKGMPIHIAARVA